MVLHCKRGGMGTRVAMENMGYAAEAHFGVAQLCHPSAEVVFLLIE